MATLWGEFDEKSSLEHSLLMGSDFSLQSYEVKGEGTFVVPTAVDNREENNSSSERKVDVRQGQVEHTIQLEKYRTQLHILLGTAVQLMSEDRSTAVFADSPPFPVCVDCHKKQSADPDSDVHDRDFVRGIGIVPALISPDTCAQLVKKSVAQICLHQGYHDSQPSALDALVGACEEFYSRLLTQLRCNVDSEATKGHSGFQDAMHRTLTQAGQGDMGALLDNYYHTVVVRHDKLLSTCRQLESAYQHIVSTRELPERLANILPPPIQREPAAVFSLSDTEEKSEAAASNADPEDAMGEDDDPQKLLELAGLSGFDITIQGEFDGELMAAAPSSAEPTVEPPKPKSKAKTKSKTSAASAKRRKKH